MFDMSDSKEKLYIETDYSCAYCGQKGLDNLSVDHIDGKNARKANSYDNLIVLCHNCHHRKTNGKGITLDQIKKLKNLQKILINTIHTETKFLHTLHLQNKKIMKVILIL